MAVVEIKVPGVGESVQEGMIESWHKDSGNWVEVDEVILELETDKATVEITAEAEGVLEITVPAESVVKVGDVIGKIDTSATKPAGSKSFKQREPSPEAEVRELESISNQGSVASAKVEPNLTLSPAVRRMAAEGVGNPAAVQGTGRGGRVTKSDLIAQSTAKGASTRESSPSMPAATSISSMAEGRAETSKPMSMLRRRIAERLISSQQTAAILTTFNEVDMTSILEIRKKYKESFLERHGVKLGFMGFFLKASVEGLKDFPLVNAYIEGTNILYHNYCDIGVAVSTKKGLMVPIVRDVDRLSLAGIETEIGNFAAKARENKISMDDLSGGTFTVSNGGVFGSLLSTPIINPPQSAILGMHKTQMRPMVMLDGSIEARPMMYLALSYDHRIIDGKEAVGFLVKLKDCLEDPSRMFLGV